MHHLQEGALIPMSNHLASFSSQQCLTFVLPDRHEEEWSVARHRRTLSLSPLVPQSPRSQSNTRVTTNRSNTSQVDSAPCAHTCPLIVAHSSIQSVGTRGKTLHSPPSTAERWPQTAQTNNTRHDSAQTIKPCTNIHTRCRKPTVHKNRQTQWRQETALRWFLYDRTSDFDALWDPLLLTPSQRNVAIVSLGPQSNVPLTGATRLEPINRRLSGKAGKPCDCTSTRVISAG
mmetsp:Transcript_36580/g.97524  ORF Transcript_36580/g.97524 Transcript_36580/m.97524 type:complete len:231 (-) Transcript_36580:506-1198(-)